MKLIAMFPAEIVVSVDGPVFRFIGPLTLTLSPADEGEGTRNCQRALSLLGSRAVAAVAPEGCKPRLAPFTGGATACVERRRLARVDVE